MWRRLPVCYCLAAILLLLRFAELADAAAGPSILTSDAPLQQFQTRSPLDPRPRLSTSQQTQILSDVQQHREFGSNAEAAAGSDGGALFSPLAKYKVDRKKQTQQIQQQLQSLQSLQNRIQQQQQQINSQLGQAALQTSGPVYQQQFDLKSQYPTLGGAFNYQTLPPIPLPNIPGELPQTLFNEQQNAQLQEYYEKQRQLELLQRQREQLLLEQQELRRQQELLRLQQQQLRTTLLPAAVPTTLAPPVTTTFGPLLPSPTARRITPSENDIFLRAIATHQKKFAAATTSSGSSATTTTTSTTSTTTPSPRPKQRQERVQDEQSIPKDLLALIQQQQQQQQSQAQGRTKPQVKLIYQSEKPGGVKPDKDLLLRQLKIALAQSGVDDKERNVTTRDIVLPNGKKLQVIHAPNGLPANAHTTTLKPPKLILDELTKGVGEFEVLRQNIDGKLEEVKNPVQNAPTKKVTFVVLEEQPDGSYKVQGVKGNVDKDAGTDVDSIVERIKKGELKLPPSSRSPAAATAPPASTDAPTSSPPTTFRPTLPTTRRPQLSVSPNSVSARDKYVTSASSISGHVLNSISTTAKPAVTLKYPLYTSSFDANDVLSSGAPSATLAPATRSSPSSSASSGAAAVQPSAPSGRDGLSNLLRKEGLFAMAKYLRQSGLDSVLNETGPYTIFVPTDKAFRTLLVQLGGPEKAEQKFRDNPRLLSGLLLHHVVPGAFKIDSLQDEMTGVSLAGTQLRVNVYSMHDHEWNDIKVTTINGARVAPNKRDVEIPQGLAHAIDRVMFPLPVGDLVQTLQADRERRFATFLKLLHVSGLEETLSGRIRVNDGHIVTYNVPATNGVLHAIDTVM
ncbi:uncharacterized protein LOC131665104 isoform X2 [Phymastichus coffea]|uniref:uncharacterized protein LOC131665104 isoform X2 n=1 Tax=Phymastichus coffea TaxID=108790 RepID=UPI00273BBC0B|nr:uncharacterized protein LOC131665104 isoform X2 [Phymastichus coffea]